MRRRLLLGGLQIAAGLIGVFLLYRVFRGHDAREIVTAIARIPAANILLAALCTVGSFLCLAANEWQAMAYATRRRLTARPRVNPWRILTVAVAAIGIGHSIGFAALSSGAVRYRMYTRDGLDAAAVARLLVFCGLTVLVTITTIIGAALAWDAPALDPLLTVSPATRRWAAVFLFACVGFYLGLCAYGAKIRIRRVQFATPPLGLAFGQLAAGVGKYICIGGVMYACLAPLTQVEYPLVVALIAVSDGAALIAHVPGGWGVLEYIVVSALGGAKVVAAVVVFRSIYYLAPLGLGVLLLAADEMAGAGWWRRTAQRTAG